MLIKGTINQQEITIININIPNTEAPSFITQTLLDLKAQIDSNTMIVEDFNTPPYQ
jgi:N-methylhydantoinase B/oxoprolinase/acetone carboxylase alpha subunit